MLTKILFTALIIAGAVFYLRKKAAEEHEGKSPLMPSSEETTNNSEQQKSVKFIAYGVLVIAFVSGIIVFYENWQEDHRLYDIRVVNPQTGQEDTYQAYKKDLHGRWFITLTGQQIAVSEMERLEFVEAD